MSGKPIPEEAVAQVCDRMLTAAIGKDWRKRAPEAVTAFWMGEVREALQEAVPALTAAQQQGQAVCECPHLDMSEPPQHHDPHCPGRKRGQAEAVRLLREYRKAPKFSNDHDAIKRTVALEDEIDAFLAALAQQPAAPSEAVNVVGMPEFDGLIDHIYEYGTTAEGVVERANAFARAVLARYAPQQPSTVDEAYPTPRNRAEAVTLARLALAHLGVIDAHIDAAIARCETNLATQPGGSDNDR